MSREPNDGEREYDTDDEQDITDGFEPGNEAEPASAESGQRAQQRSRAQDGQRSGSKSPARATGKTDSKRAGQRTGAARTKRSSERSRSRTSR